MDLVAAAQRAKGGSQRHLVSALNELHRHQLAGRPVTHQLCDSEISAPDVLQLHVQQSMSRGRLPRRCRSASQVNEQVTHQLVVAVGVARVHDGHRAGS